MRQWGILSDTMRGHFAEIFDCRNRTFGMRIRTSRTWRQRPACQSLDPQDRMIRQPTDNQRALRQCRGHLRRARARPGCNPQPAGRHRGVSELVGAQALEKIVAAARAAVPCMPGPRAARRPSPLPPANAQMAGLAHQPRHKARGRDPGGTALFHRMRTALCGHGQNGRHSLTGARLPCHVRKLRFMLDKRGTGNCVWAQLRSTRRSR